MIPVTPTTPMAFGQTHKPQFVANAGATKNIDADTFEIEKLSLFFYAPVCANSSAMKTKTNTQ